MVHLRFNERESNPNPFVSFISVLPLTDATAEAAALQLLRGLAAQVKPVMKAHGFVVNSLEEYEHNSIFAGRNWNSGETIELVLRGSNGSLQPIDWLLSTLCHELAHIKHMNHGPAFQALWRQLRQEVRALQNRGYSGDGYWSSGRRLADSAKVAGQGIEAGDLPEYMCGGAHLQSRPTSFRRRRSRANAAGPSLHTGPQTAKKRKAGSRVTNSHVFKSAGTALNEDLGENKGVIGKGFRKKAGSKRAREEHALAAEKRIQALRRDLSPSASLASTSASIIPSGISEDNLESTETDEDRRRILLETIKPEELHMLKAAEYGFADDFVLLRDGQRRDANADDAIVVSSTLNERKRPHLKRSRVGQLEIPRDRAVPSLPMATIATKELQDTWSCLVCTLINESNHLACSACSTAHGDSQWLDGLRNYS